MGFVSFILSLEKSTYKYQFTQFGWTHITLLLVVLSASCMIKNMFEGMVWFFLPVCLVIWNDVYAYVFGNVLDGDRWIDRSIDLPIYRSIDRSVYI